MIKSIYKAYSTSLLGIFSGLLSQLVFIRELVHSVSSDQFALYAFAFQVVTYMSILQLGLDFASSREIAIRLGQKNYKGACESFLFIKKFNNKICIVGLLVILSCSLFFYYGIGVSIKFNHLIAAKLILLFGLSMVINFLSNPSIVALIGSNLQSKVNINNIVVTIATTCAAFFLLKTTSLGLFSMPLALIVFNLINLFILRNKAYRFCSEWLNNDNSFEIPLHYRNSIIKFAVITTIGGAAWTIEATSDVFILSGTGYIELVGIYVLWWRFPQMFFDMATRLTNSALPSLNSSFGRSEEQSKNIFNKLLIVVGGVGFCFYVGIANWLPAFINLWIGKRFLLDESHFNSLLIGMLVYSRVVGNCLGMYTITIGQVNYSATLSWIQAFVKVVIAIILVKHMGIVGLFIASLVGSLLQILGSTFLLIKRNLLRIDVLLLIIFGLLAPAILLFLNISERYSILNFSIGTLTTIALASIIWILFVRILSLNKKLNFSFSPKVFLNSFK